MLRFYSNHTAATQTSKNTLVIFLVFSQIFSRQRVFIVSSKCFSPCSPMLRDNSYHSNAHLWETHVLSKGS